MAIGGYLKVSQRERCGALTCMAEIWQAARRVNFVATVQRASGGRRSTRPHLSQQDSSGNYLPSTEFVAQDEQL